MWQLTIIKKKFEDLFVAKLPKINVKICKILIKIEKIWNNGFVMLRRQIFWMRKVEKDK